MILISMKQNSLIILLLFITLTLQAKIKPVANYNFGKSGNVTYAVAPETISPVKGGNKLTAVGRPLFYADAPGEKAMKGEGSVLFNGNGDGYQSDKSYGTPGENILFEVWVKARTLDYGGEGKNQQRVVVANGNGKTGYVIAQHGLQWVLISGGSGTTVIGDVIKGQWVHLAMVADDKSTSVWYNGEKTGSFNRTKSIVPSFSIACDENGDASFYGDIYEVRYSTFDNGKFDP